MKIQPEAPLDMTNLTGEQLIEIWENTLTLIDEYLAQKEAVKVEFEARIEAGKMPDADEVAGYSVTRFPKVYVNKVTLETAKKYGATKTKEVVDTTIVTKLVKSGEEIPGAEIRQQILIAKLREKGAENG